MSAARSALSRAQSWLIEPPGPLEALAPAATAPRPLVAVCGIAGGCGATAIARALAAELAARDPLRSAVVAGPDGRGALPLATPAAARLARLVADRVGVEARPSGRLCLATGGDPLALGRALRGEASLVLDVAARHRASAAASLADHVVVVAVPGTEPALAEIVAASLARTGPRPLIVLNRAAAAADPSTPAAERLRAKPVPAWAGRADVVVPSSAAAARLALGCRGAGGAFGSAVAALADRCAQP
ncbi:MAG: hypothetical protein WD844_07445 [Thermoleophilaceae bacterium]